MIKPAAWLCLPIVPGSLPGLKVHTSLVFFNPETLVLSLTVPLATGKEPQDTTRNTHFSVQKTSGGLRGPEVAAPLNQLGAGGLQKCCGNLSGISTLTPIKMEEKRCYQWPEARMLLKGVQRSLDNSGLGSLLPLHGFQELKSSYQACLISTFIH